MDLRVMCLSKRSVVWDLPRTCTHETIPRQVLSIHHRLQQKAVPRVFRDAQVGRTWCEQVSGKLNEDWNTVSPLFGDNELFDQREGRVCWESLEEWPRSSCAITRLGESHLYVHGGCGKGEGNGSGRVTRALT